MRHARWNGKMLFSRALRKHGLEAFDFQVLATCGTQECADILEKRYIIMYQTRVPFGYNVAAGGHELTKKARLALARKKLREELILKRYRRRHVSA